MFLLPVFSPKLFCGNIYKRRLGEQTVWEFVSEWSDSQTALVTTLMLIVGGGLGVWLGSALFGGRVKNLEEALDKSKTEIDSYISSISKNIDEHNDKTENKLQEIDQLLKETISSVSQLKHGVDDIRDAAEQSDDELRSELKQTWYSIRERLQREASSEWIHGRTRNRYASYSNNEMSELVDAMEHDGILYGTRLNAYKSAAELWRYHRNGKPILTSEDVQNMKKYSLQTPEEVDY